jgi:hypothetical protein
LLIILGGCGDLEDAVVVLEARRLFVVCFVVCLGNSNWCSRGREVAGTGGRCVPFRLCFQVGRDHDERTRRRPLEFELCSENYEERNRRRTLSEVRLHSHKLFYSMARSRMNL